MGRPSCRFVAAVVGDVFDEIDAVLPVLLATMTTVEPCSVESGHESTVSLLVMCLGEGTVDVIEVSGCQSSAGCVRTLWQQAVAVSASAPIHVSPHSTLTISPHH